MTQRTSAAFLGLALALLLVSPPVQAGGFLEQVDITDMTPFAPGFVVAPLIPIRHDDRCIPVQYRVNDLDPIPNPAGPAVLTLADATAAFQRAFDSWNNIRTSYIEYQIVGNVTSAVPNGFDFVNELTFITPPGFGAIAVSPSVSLLQDSTFPAGTDLDGDGDSDFDDTITTCADVDGDGDIEFPAGTYAAGTILDNDNAYNTALTFTNGPPDANSSSVDLEAVAVHEMGHSMGLSHVLGNQRSSFDGGSVTMYPFIDTGDPDAELQQRTIDSDDRAFASFHYPEGSSASGPGALQPGDFDFDWIYGTIEGTLEHGVLGGPIAGASVRAVDFFGQTWSSAFSGHAQLLFQLSTGSLFLSGNPAQDVIDGNFTIPVPLGLYKIGIEATDGLPVPASSISLTAIIGNAYGQQNFNEEFWDGNREASLENSPASAKPVFVFPGNTKSGVDIVTNEQIEIAPYTAVSSIGFTGSTPGTYYAVRIPGADVIAATGGNPFLLHGVEYATFVVDSSVVPRYAKAMLTTGSVDGAGVATVDLAHPLRQKHNFVGDDGDFANFWFFGSRGLGNQVRNRINNGQIEDLFIVLQIPNTATFPGPAGIPPLIGLDANAPILGQSYVSSDGVTWTQSASFNFMFSLVMSAVP